MVRQPPCCSWGARGGLWPVTTAPWARPSARPSTCRHPAELASALGAFLFVAFPFLLGHRGFQPGILFGAFGHALLTLLLPKFSHLGLLFLCEDAAGDFPHRTPVATGHGLLAGFFELGTLLRAQPCIPRRLLGHGLEALAVSLIEFTRDAVVGRAAGDDRAAAISRPANRCDDQHDGNDDLCGRVIRVSHGSRTPQASRLGVA
jgi:hypothetical protein